jgi:D-3-phosphoglycerate dehydrogenase
MFKLRALIIEHVHPVLTEKLESSGIICDYLPDINSSEIEDIIHNYEGLILRSKISVNPAFLRKALKLKFIGRAGSGLENIDTGYADSKGVICFNSPEGNRDAVGEHALGMLLSLFHKLCSANNQVKNGIWNRLSNRGIELKGKTVGIIGYGNTGSAFAKRLSGFEANVISFDKYKYNYSDDYTREVTLDEIFYDADILSLHVPLTPETYYMADDRFISIFRKNFWLINTSRGQVLKTIDLAKNIKTGKILGAALDVLEYESSSFEELHAKDFPEYMQYLLASDNVILSPHIAGWTDESNYKIADILADKIVSYFTEKLVY